MGLIIQSLEFGFQCQKLLAHDESDEPDSSGAGTLIAIAFLLLLVLFVLTGCNTICVFANLFLIDCGPLSDGGDSILDCSSLD